MIIALSGAQGTGKSQVMELVRAKLGWPVLTSSSSTAWKEYYALHNIPSQTSWWDLSPTHQENYQLSYMHKACAAAYAVGNTNYLFDRSFYDSYVYAQHKRDRLQLSESALSAIQSTYLLISLSLKNKLHTMLFTPDPAYPCETRDQRESNTQNEISRLFIKIVPTLNNCLMVPFGTLEKKAQAIVDYIEEHVHDKKCRLCDE